MADLDPFVAISEDTIAQCDAVECSPEEYRAGLRTIMADLQVSLEASEATTG